MSLLRFLGVKPKKSKRRQANSAFEYGTHLPVLRSIVQVFQPKGVLELGAGRCSTPMFYRSVQNVVTVETDPQWIQEIAKMLPARDGFSLIHHQLGISSRIRVDSLAKRVKTEAISYYRELLARNPGLDLLFIDHVSGLRAFTLAGLYNRFDFIVYHDAEDPGYGYDQFPHAQAGDYYHHVLRSFVPHTGFLIHRKHSNLLPDFLRILDRNALAYVSEHYRFDLECLSNQDPIGACAG